MHTYYQDPDTKKWIVIFTTGNHDTYTIKVFKSEIQAITLVNYLNGSNQDVNLIAALLEVSI